MRLRKKKKMEKEWRGGTSLQRTNVEILMDQAQAGEKYALKKEVGQKKGGNKSYKIITGKKG